MRTSLFCSILTLVLLPVAARAADPVREQAMMDRMNQLEAETQTLRTEVQWLRENPVRLPQVEATPVGAFPAATFNATALAEAAPAEDEGDYFTWSELQAEMKRLAWTKGEFRIVPYGALWGSINYATERTAPGAYTLYVLSADAEGEDTFVIDTRRTRFGLDVAGPRILLFGGAQSGGKLEIDFHGAFVVENKPGILLRHAYGEIKDERFRLLAGQTWDIVSPLYPGVLSYSVGWGGGNIGYRRAQVRMERYLDFSDVMLVTLQGSLNQNIVSDFNTTAGVDPEAADWPLIEGRMAFTLGDRGESGLPVVLGVSGHIGEQGFDFTEVGPAPLSLPAQDDERIRTWSFNVDMRVPLTERCGVQGEFFTGENLGTFLGGVVQGVDLGTRRGIRSTGGWVDTWYDWTPRFHSHAGFGIDDPRDGDVTDGRTYNHFIFVNSSYDITKNMNVGLEVTSSKTLYTANRPGDSVQFEFSGKYAF